MAIDLNELKRLAEAAKRMNSTWFTPEVLDKTIGGDVGCYIRYMSPDVMLRLIEMIEATMRVVESARRNLPHNPDFHKATRLPSNLVCCQCEAKFALEEIAKLEQGNVE